MQKPTIQYYLAVILSVTFIVATEWSALTRKLGGYYNPNETRYNAVLTSTVFCLVLGLALYAMARALKNNRLFAIIGWIAIAPTMLMLSWDIITKNLVERGLISVAWLTDSAYINEPGVRMNRMAWIIAGAIAAMPFIFIACKRLVRDPEAGK
jgi:hypothetical protein